MSKVKHSFLAENDQKIVFDDTIKTGNYICTKFVIVSISNKKSKEEAVKAFGINFLFNSHYDFSLIKKNNKNIGNLNFSPIVNSRTMFTYINCISLPAWMEAHIISFIKGGLS